MLVKALEASGVGGTFKIISEKVMELLRNNKDSLLAILGSFLYDPLISFKLMIPMIIKQKRLENKSIKKSKNNLNENYNNNNNDSRYMKNTLSSSLRLKRNSLLNLNNFFHINNNINIDNNEINEENDLINNNSPKRKSYIKHDISNVEKEKTRKK
jgi:phosphatidylinositol kinase/protein kinase (PI-3  family)